MIPLSHRISIAPMMGYTDRHYRMLMRHLSRYTLLYTEMITTAALLRGNQRKFLKFFPQERPLALQLGGSDPASLALCARIAWESGYDEVNLNVGCPSNRVTAGRFGACLLKEPDLVADCVSAMQSAVKGNIPISVKTRIGVDDCDDYDYLYRFVKTVADAGCLVFIIHARKAWLKGLSPAENRTIPPLSYATVYQLKEDFPHLKIVINGGIKTIATIDHHLQRVDGVMIGREAYANPSLFALVDHIYFGETEENSLSSQKVVLQYLSYAANQLGEGVSLRSMIRHLNGLFQGCPGAKKWRCLLHENASQGMKGIANIQKALDTGGFFS